MPRPRRTHLSLPLLAAGWLVVAASARAQEPDLDPGLGAETGEREAEPAPQIGEEPPAAPSDDELDWPYPRFRPLEYVVTFGTPLVFRLIDQNAQEASAARWEGPILVDQPMRDLLVPDSRSGRDQVEKISDWLWYGTMFLPVVDTLVTPLLVHGDPYVTWQMFAINLQAYALQAFVTLTTILAVARERPNEDECDADSEYIALCGSGDLRSFPSGHTSGSFTGAGLFCAHHTSLPLYGGGVPDTAACVAALGAASSVALLRVAADRHYFSDVVVGAGIGLGIGWLLPWLLHYRHATPGDEEPPPIDPGIRAAAVPWSDGRGGGIDLLGIF